MQGKDKKQPDCKYFRAEEGKAKIAKGAYRGVSSGGTEQVLYLLFQYRDFLYFLNLIPKLCRLLAVFRLVIQRKSL